jgi:hypothetical protein
MTVRFHEAPHTVAQLYGLPHGILRAFNTILYENEFQNPQIFQQTISLYPEQSTLKHGKKVPSSMGPIMSGICCEVIVALLILALICPLTMISEKWFLMLLQQCLLPSSSTGCPITHGIHCKNPPKRSVS